MSLALLAGALVGCKSKPPPKPVVDPAVAAADVEAARALEHRREPFNAEWSRLAQSPSPAARATVAMGLGRGAEQRALPTLWNLLGDPAVEVRRTAAFAVGAYETRLAPGGDGRTTREKMWARLLEETDGPTIAALVLAFGRVGGETAELVLDRALVHPLVEVREAGALGLGRLAGVSLHSARKLLSALPPLFEREKEKSVRQAAAFALSRIGAPFPALLADPDPLVRFFTWQAAAKEATTPFRGAPRKGLPFARGFADGDVFVRVAAVNAAAASGESSYVAQALRGAWQLATASPAAISSALMQPVLAGLAAANKSGAAMSAPLKGVLTELHEQAAVTKPAERTPQSLGTLDAVHCAAASALDVAAGAPERVLRCGEPRVPDWRRKRLAAKLLAHVRGGTVEARLASLGALVRDVDPRVRSATGDALALVWNAPGVRGLVLGALKTRDTAVLAALFDAIAAKGARDADMEAAVLESAPSLRSGRDADVMVSLADALGAIGTPKAAPLLLKLAQDPVRAVREAARKTMRRIYPADPAPPPHAATMTEHPAAVAPDGAEMVVRVHTSQGTFDMRLLRHLAPRTVGNFVALVRKGFYRGLLVHRVVPAFVAQMGDPRGDGTGGPGYAVPCELTPTRYRRGSVGIALAGRDTGGSQFFVTHTDAPHLDGAYPLFAEVVRGMEVVDALVEGDVLQNITFIAE